MTAAGMEGVTLRVGILNASTMTDKGKGHADVIKRGNANKPGIKTR